MSPAHTATPAARPEPTREQVRRWRRYLADEIAEGQIYRDIAARKDGVERDILLGLAEAERRHEQHWRALLGEHAENPPRPSLHRILLRWLARIFGSVFVLALAQRAESDTPYAEDQDAPEGMAADEAIHEEVVRGLAARGREQLAGNFRAAVFGMNDGLVSNLALVMGIGATGVAPSVVLFTGVAGLLAGALSMAAGEYVSVRSQRELLEASSPTQITLEAAQHLDLDHNELKLVYLARGMTPEDAEHRALERLGYLTCDCNPRFSARPDGSQDPWTTRTPSRRSARRGAPPCPASRSSPPARSSRSCRTSSACPGCGPWAWRRRWWARPCSSPAVWSGCCPAPHRWPGACASSRSASAPPP